MSSFVEPISPTILPRHNSGSLYVSSCRKSWGRCEAASLNFCKPATRGQKLPEMRTFLQQSVRGGGCLLSSLTAYLAQVVFAPRRKPRHPVSNAVARADILRCPEVVADQAGGQKDVEADLWARVPAA